MYRLATEVVRTYAPADPVDTFELLLLRPTLELLLEPKEPVEDGEAPDIDCEDDSILTDFKAERLAQLPFRLSVATLSMTSLTFERFTLD